MKRVRFAHLVVVASLFLALVPSIANAAWDTYDLYSHHNCHFDSSGVTWDAESTLGYIRCSSGTNELSCRAFCSIHSLEPREPQYLDHVNVDCYNRAGTTDFKARLCARDYDSSNVDCTDTISAASGSGFKTIQFDSSVTGWSTLTSNGNDHYLYVYVDAYDDEDFMGYRVYWDLP